jgi:membrane protein YdbS with pleckstrin-like domain
LIMLTTEEIAFLKYWEQNRKKKKNSIWQMSIGLPLGVLIVATLFVNIIAGWHKKASMVLYSHSSLILVVLIAAVSIVVFITVFSSKHRWEMQEQQYQELLVKQQTELEAANVSET